LDGRTSEKANANKHQYTKQQVLRNTKDYVDELNTAVAEDRKNMEKSLKPREEVNEEKEIKVSTTDPDSRYMIRDCSPEVSSQARLVSKVEVYL
jgi:surface antigen